LLTNTGSSETAAFEVRDDMFAIPAARPILVARQDRRATRAAYLSTVLLDGVPAPARDISSTGLSVFLRQSVAPGHRVRVTLAGTPGQTDEISTTARVSRVQDRSGGFIVGLQFIE
jgi:hypothetical protein